MPSPVPETTAAPPGSRLPSAPAAFGLWPAAFIAALVLVATAGAAETRSPRELYLAACASCHGADGRGMPVTEVGFEIPLPDFTDCEFGPREPDADWLAVTHEGGPARGFDRMMPALGDALTEEEIESVVGYVRTFCTDRRWPRGELNLPRPLVTGKAFPEDEAVFSTTASLEGRGTVTNRIIYEKRFGPVNQWEVVFPFSLAEGHPANEGSSWRGGVGDIALALKRALFHDLDRGTIFSAAAEVVLPTGNDDRGFGKGTTVFEPFVAWGQILPRDSFLQMQGGLQLPQKGDDEAFLRLALGRSFEQWRFGRTWSPMVEVLAARDLVSGATTHFDAVPQVQFTLNTRQHVMANIGVRVPVNEREGRDTQLMMYLLWDWFDGGFFDGW
jgi:mono/diheme cytochrome c family protein